MKKFCLGVAAALISTISVQALAADDTIHHEMEVSLAPATSSINAVDTITLPASLRDEQTILKLNAGLDVSSQTDGVTLVLLEENADAPDVGIDREDVGANDPRAKVRVDVYRVDGLPEDGDASFTVELKGAINNTIRQLGAEYARGFSQSPGLIEDRGIYLAGSTQWVPTFGDHMITYEIDVDLPKGWLSVSQGKRTVSQDEGDIHNDVWVVDTPTEEIYLIGARFTEYSYDVGAVKAMAFLRTPDDTMANTYLETTAQYLEMYRNMLGPYPYSKFALVENFWETGYGMPSFTLLGEQIIRFPFILHSSYPHELLHNWWGNGVFVDFDSGNWCEGLTAYMADHLVAEQRGTGANYRRAILQKYTDYVDVDTDFPLSEFLSRYNAATEAVGYGKSAMTWNMLRDRVGDEDFIRGFQAFYRDNKFKSAGYQDIRASFEKVTGEDLEVFFDQWVNKAGSLNLALTDAAAQATGSSYQLSFSINQIQDGDAYVAEIPVAIYTEDDAKIHKVSMSQKTQSFTLNLSSKPLRVMVDPAFDLFRKLHHNEVPPSLTKVFGAEKVVMLLPASAESSLVARYQKLADLWSEGQGSAFTVKKDSELTELPADSAVWVLGWENTHASAIKDALKDYDAEIKEASVRFGGTELAANDNSFIVAVRHPNNPAQSIVWLTAHSDAAVPGLASKLPHYGKYSYLAFATDEPANVAKGEWPAVNSPLVADLSDAAPTAELAKRAALAQLAPVFSSDRMKEHVTYLASEELGGRGVGTEGIEKAADYIAAKFEEYGLQPAGDDGTYFQTFNMGYDVRQPEVPTRNVVAVLPGTEEGWSDQSVVVSAHYDHLGKDHPAIGASNAGQIHPGADDNASGVAVMLELAQNLAKNLKPKRSIIFVAFSGEESGLRGAHHYVENQKTYPLEKVIGNLNLDTVGRLGENKLTIFGAPSAREWQFIFMGATAVTGVETEIVTNVINASDHTAFSDRGVPAVQFFSGANEGYHKPSDTADKIDGAGMVKVAAIVREGIQYLAERPEPLTFQGEVKPAQQASVSDAPGQGRRVSTGTTPDFTFSGEGVRITQVAEGSPAAKAGLVVGDIITGLGEHNVDGLQAYTDALKTFAPGDAPSIRYQRDGEEFTSTIELVSR